MNKLKKYLFVFFIVVWSNLTGAYILNQTKSGIPVHWPTSSTVIDIYVNSDNSQALDEATVQSIAGSSLSQWNGASRISIRKNSTSLKGQANFNELYFTTDSSVFNGSGVIGVTQVSFKETSGEIVEADILINDNYSFSTVSTDTSYLGNVITHEAGHFLGLGHGQVLGSTMFYALSKGQHTVESDDLAGLYTIYPNSDASKGSISGTVIGGKSVTSVFGAHVQALSVKTGKVMGASISESNGKFKINGLSIDDQYLIYTSPIAQLGLPTNYANVKNDFCESSKNYRGSFFQSCGSSSEGFPQAVKLTTSSVNVGNMTIRCGLDSPPEYLRDKGVTPASFDVNSYSNSGLGGSFVGFFSSSEIQSGTAHDYFRLNFSDVSDWNSISTSPSLYLELKILNQTFNSMFKANVSIKRSSGTTTVVPKYNQNSDGWLNIETVTRVLINRSDSSDNNFEINIAPEDMQNGFPSGIPYSSADYFPSNNNLADSAYFYLASASIVKDNGDGTFTQVSSRSDTISDNTRCPDAINTYALTNYTVTGVASESNRKKAVGCGTVDLDGKPGSGPGGFMVGLILSLILSYALSRYSKMA